MKKAIFFVFCIFAVSLLISAEIKLNMSSGRVLDFDSSGNLYRDWGENSIAKFSPSGDRLLIMGRKGEGPGDIKRMGWFALNPLDGIIYVTEFVGGNKWISKFSTEGKYLGEWPIEIDLRSITFSGLSIIKIDSKGNTYIQTYKGGRRKYKDMTIGTTENIIIRFSPKGKRLGDIYRFKDDFYADKPGKGNITIPFCNYLEWTLWDNKIIVREHRQPYINIFSVDGKLEKRLNIPFKQERVKESDLDKWEEFLKSFPKVKQSILQGILDLKYWRKNLPFPKYKPISGHQMFVDSHNNLYSKKYSDENNEENIWAKINLHTQETSIVKFKNGYKLIGIRENFFFFSAYDEDDNRFIIKIDEKELLNGK